MTEGVVIRALGGEPGEVLLDHAQAIFSTLILRGLGDVILVVGLRLHVKRSGAESLLDEAETGHRDAGAIDIAQFKSVQGLVSGGVDAVGGLGPVGLGVSAGESAQGRVGDREAGTFFLGPESGFDLLEKPAAILELPLGAERRRGVQIPSQGVLRFVGREVLRYSRRRGIVPLFDRRAHTRAAVDISRAAGQAEQQGSEKRTHGNRQPRLPRPAHK